MNNRRQQTQRTCSDAQTCFSRFRVLVSDAELIRRPNQRCPATSSRVTASPWWNYPTPISLTTSTSAPHQLCRGGSCTRPFASAPSPGLASPDPYGGAGARGQAGAPSHQSHPSAFIRVDPRAPLRSAPLLRARPPAPAPPQVRVRVRSVFSVPLWLPFPQNLPQSASSITSTAWLSNNRGFDCAVASHPDRRSGTGSQPPCERE